MTETEHHSQPVSLTQDQIKEIASRAAEKVIERITQHIYQRVGRSMINNLTYVDTIC